MAIQDAIDLIDPTKPVNFSATQKPSLKSLRDNTAAIKQALQGLLDREPGAGGSGTSQSLIFLSVNTMTGTVPRLVGSALLPAGTYQAPFALLGAGDPAYSATLTLETQIGDVLATVGGVVGGVDYRTASAGFTLTATTLVEFVLVCSAVNQPAFIHGLVINKD